MPILDIPADALYDANEEPEVIRAKYFIRDEFLVSIMRRERERNNELLFSSDKEKKALMWRLRRAIEPFIAIKSTEN